MNTEQRFAAVMAKLAEVFRVQLTPVMVEAYREALDEWPLDSLEAAARVVIKESTFFPRPVELSAEAERWLIDRRTAEQSRLLALVQSNEPPLTQQEVKRLVDEVSAKLGWPRS